MIYVLNQLNLLKSKFLKIITLNFRDREERELIEKRKLLNRIKSSTKYIFECISDKLGKWSQKKEYEKIKDN